MHISLKTINFDLPFSPTRFGFVHLLCDPSVKLADTQFIFIGELSQYHYVSVIKPSMQL